MKRWVICILGLCLLLPLTGLARDQLTWEQRSAGKLTRAVATFVVEPGEDGTPQVREVGSLPAGTHVVFCDCDRETKLSKIVHNITGSETEAWIRDRDALVSTIVHVNFDDGTYLDFPEALVNDRATLLRILRQMFPNRTITPIAGSTKLHMSNQAPSLTPVPNQPVDKSTAQDKTTTPKQQAPGKHSEAERAFNIDSPWRLQQTVTGYTDAHKTKASASIPIGTYAQIVMAQIVMDYNDVVQIGYYQDGVYKKAHIDRAALLNNFTQYRNQAGEILNISPADPLYEKVVSENEITHLSDGLRTNLDERIALSQEAARKGMAVAQLGEQAVQVEQLGLVTSQINAGDGRVEVPTADLTFEGAPDAHQLAAIHAPKTGKCSLWAAADSDSKLLKRCKAGVLVQVLEKGAAFTKINYKGQVGYVRSDCLYVPVERLTAEQGMLAYNGQTTGSTTINLRNSPGKEHAKVAEWETGTPITILSKKDGWLMVESKGVLAFVMEEFVKKEN